MLYRDNALAQVIKNELSALNQNDSKLFQKLDLYKEAIIGISESCG